MIGRGVGDRVPPHLLDGHALGLQDEDPDPLDGGHPASERHVGLMPPPLRLHADAQPSPQNAGNGLGVLIGLGGQVEDRRRLVQGLVQVQADLAALQGPAYV
jgi:hypothetical protein